MPRKGHPDYVVDPDRGTGGVSAKNAVLLDEGEHAERAQSRAGLRDLDAMTEGMSGLTRMQKDRERLFPRETNADLGDPRMRRTLPAEGEVRLPLSSRQRKERSKDRTETLAALPQAQGMAQATLVSRADRWADINNQLSETTSDLQEMSPANQEQVRRIDRSIQAYERRNDRGHVVYSNVRMPHYINHGNVDGFVRNNFEAGRRLSFDRYTAATHQMHETAQGVSDPDGRVVMLEIQTRRGAYLGQSDRVDNTQHLLPRGLELEVVGSHRATYATPDGTTETRLVVQVRDVTPNT